MGIESIDEIADAMVRVCVRDFGADPADADGGLLWTYFRGRLLESARDVQDEIRREQAIAIRRIGNAYTRRSEDVKELEARRVVANELAKEAKARKVSG